MLTTPQPFSHYPVHHLMFITKRPPLVFTEGRGMWITDNQGKRYLDFVQGWAVNTFGHSPILIQNTLKKQAKKLIHPSAAFYNAPAIKLASLLTEYSCFDRVFFASSGAEANEGAFKLARKWGTKNPNAAGEARFEIITFHNSFHGRTLACTAASGKSGWENLFAPPIPGFYKAEWENIDSVRALITPHTVAIMIEPIQGEVGAVPASTAFMQNLRSLTQEHHLLLIVDEVQSGMGRCGTLFAYQHAHIEPDIMTLGKGIGGGVPLAALLAKETVSCFEAGEQGGTYAGNPLMTAVGVAIMEALLAPKSLVSIQNRAQYLHQQLLKLSEKHGLAGEQGQGLLRALKLGKEIGPEIVHAARNLNPKGLLLNSPRPHLIRFMPALNVTKKEIDTMIAMLSEVLRIVT